MSTISSGTTLTTALVQTGDTTGDLVIKTGASNTTAMTISGTDQSITFAGAVNVSSSAFANGSASSPSITFTGDTNTGIFSPAADTIAFTEGGVESMRITSDGNVGIGNTPSGTFKLEVSGLVSDTAGNLRSLPLNSQTSAYVAAATDNGKVISITTGGVTINNSVFSAGMVLTIYNNSGSSQTITQGAGVTMQWAGQSSSTTGSRTLGLYGMATVYFLSASSAVITGSGLT
jgi:hypothetical protein